MQEGIVPDLRDFITTEDAASMLQFHVEHVRRLLREGDLKGEKIGTAWLVLKTSVDEYIQDTKGLNKFDPRRARH
jgi:excisionase family DNA binding protein